MSTATAYYNAVAVDIVLKVLVSDQYNSELLNESITVIGVKETSVALFQALNWKPRNCAVQVLSE